MWWGGLGRVRGREHSVYMIYIYVSIHIWNYQRGDINLKNCNITILYEDMFSFTVTQHIDYKEQLYTIYYKTLEDKISGFFFSGQCFSA